MLGCAKRPIGEVKSDPYRPWMATLSAMLDTTMDSTIQTLVGQYYFGARSGSCDGAPSDPIGQARSSMLSVFFSWSSGWRSPRAGNSRQAVVVLVRVLTLVPWLAPSRWPQTILVRGWTLLKADRLGTCKALSTKWPPMRWVRRQQIHVRAPYAVNHRGSWYRCSQTEETLPTAIECEDLMVRAELHKYTLRIDVQMVNDQRESATEKICP